MLNYEWLPITHFKAMMLDILFRIVKSRREDIFFLYLHVFPHSHLQLSQLVVSFVFMMGNSWYLTRYELDTNSWYLISHVTGVEGKISDVPK